MQLPKSPDRYKRRHAWYLADAVLLVQRLQVIAWPNGWHVALGGGVLNHGYSNTDLDLYVLPIYNRPGVVDENQILTAIQTELGDITAPICSIQDSPHECFTHSIRFVLTAGQAVEVFIVRRS